MVLWVGRDTANDITGMCGECVPCMDHTGFATAQGGMCFLGLHWSGSRCFAVAQPEAGPAFCGLPRSKPLRSSAIPQGH